MSSSSRSIASLLLIEDNPGDARLLREMLNEQGIHKTKLTLVPCLSDAVEHLAEHDVDIILLDLGLPDAQGLDAVRRARAAAPRIPLVVLTGLDDENLALQSLQEGAQDYLVKGQIETRGLLRALRYAIERNLMEVELNGAFAKLGLQSRALEVAAEDMQDAHDQLSELLEHSPAVLYSMKVGAEMTPSRVVSENVSRLLGFQAAETVEAGWWHGQLHPEDHTRAEDGVSETLVRGTNRTEYRVRHKNGDYLWIDDNQRLVRDADGTPVELVGAWTDVTERRRAQDTLQESERRFSEMLNNLDLVSIMLDRDTHLTYCNDYFLRLTGWRREEVLERDWCEIFVPPDQTGELRSCLNLLSDGKPDASHHTNEMVTRSGERRLMQWSNSVLRSATGDVIGSASIGEDITDRKLAERELLRSEEHLRVIIAASTDAIWERDVETGDIYWSDRAFSMLGYTRDTFQPTFETTRTLIHPDDVRLYQDVVDANLDRGLPYQCRIRLRHANGSYLPILVRGQFLRETGRIFGVFTDLSAVERAEEQIQNQAALIDQAHDAMVVRDLDNRITFWSKGAERLYGWTSGEALGSRFDELLHVDYTQYNVAMKNALANGAGNAEIRKMTAAGVDVVVDSSWTVLRDEGGQPKAIFSIDTDITERKDFEQQLLRTQRIESLGTLAGGIAHDLNNLLMPIRMGVSLLRRLNLNAGGLQAINNIDLCAKRGSDLVNRVLLFTSGTDGVRKAVDLSLIVAEVLAIAESTFPKNISFVTSVPATLRKAVGDQTQLIQVLLNLCVNARDAMPNGGTITITAADYDIDQNYARMRGGTATGSYLTLKVTDDGIGIPQEIIDRIFEPFFTTKEIGTGTGLGLSTVQSVLRGHGGFIDASSEFGLGSSFRVCLPAHTDDATQPEQSEMDLLPPPRGTGEVILVVDDEVPILDIARQLLETSGYVVLTALNGREALAVYCREKAIIAAIVTDMMMPVMDGAELIEELRRLNPDVAIIAASGRIEPDQMSRVMRSGATRFLSKPCSGEVMLHTLSQVLRHQVA